MILRSIKEALIKKGTNVLIRVDFNITMDRERIADDFRIRRAIESIEFVLQKGGRARIISHYGRPNGVYQKDLSMRRIAQYFRRMIGEKVSFVADPTDERLFKDYSNTPEIIFFENIRFWPGEESNDRVFAKLLARWGEVYVNEAFSNSHRKHASMVAIAKLLPAFAGFDVLREVVQLKKIFQKPKRPLIAVLGGAKMSTKMPLIRRFLKDADTMLLGGAIANTIFYMKGIEIGESVIEKNIDRIVHVSIIRNKKLYLPTDVVVTTTLEYEGRLMMNTRHIHDVHSNEIIADIGPETVKQFINVLKNAGTVIWNGPLGFTEIPAFAKGTRHVLQALSKTHAFVVIGGGDTVSAVQKFRFMNEFDHVSTGGGAMLEFLSGKKLPGLEVLKKNSA